MQPPEFSVRLEYLVEQPWDLRRDRPFAPFEPADGALRDPEFRRECYSGRRLPGPARPPGGAGLAEGGRGLLIVAGLADAWGVLERRPGKVVWAEFGRRDPEETDCG
ncbi:ATP-binding protein [Streptomyces sp. NPDC051567]|uniref:ATP-binding protein n=1 Tax=Streptomyces sp. NPDC051567 TaxID=3365660 RepID=UPI0037968605